jgi:hypothetical protein
MQPHLFVAMPFGPKEVRAAIPAAGKYGGYRRGYGRLRCGVRTPDCTGTGESGCFPFRADHEPGAGDIRTDMFFELVNAADLWFTAAGRNRHSMLLLTAASSTTVSSSCRMR